MTFVTFSTKLLATFLHYRTALAIYWLNILAMGVLLYVSWKYATLREMIHEDKPQEARAAICRRVTIAQTLYALGRRCACLGQFGVWHLFLRCS